MRGDPVSRGLIKATRVKKSLHGFGLVGEIRLLNGKSLWILFGKVADSCHRCMSISQPNRMAYFALDLGGSEDNKVL